MKQVFTFLFVFSLMLVQHSFSQGCSDAGFCTMGAMKPDQLYNSDRAVKLRTLEFNLYRGKTLLSPVVYVATIDASFSIKDNSDLQIKVPVQGVEGNLGSAYGLGDISLSASTLFKEKKNFKVNGTVGFKIPTGQSDIENKTDQDLPMYYQRSLGTFDLVAGAALLSKNWLIATGIQVPLIHNNQNTFIWTEWPDYPSPSYIQKHAVGYKLKRGSDAMLRVEKNWRYANYNFNLGLLNIYRFVQDQRLNRETNKYEKLDGTTGFAISVLFGFGYEFNVSSGIKFIYGRKIIDRDVNPDGLTRHDVYSLSYVYRF